MFELLLGRDWKTIRETDLELISFSVLRLLSSLFD
jgi:hypothetical protein